MEWIGQVPEHWHVSLFKYHIERNDGGVWANDPSGAVQQGVVRALTSHQKLATLMLKSDRQAMSALTDVIYELICNQRNIDLDSTSD